MNEYLTGMSIIAEQLQKMKSEALERHDAIGVDMAYIISGFLAQLEFENQNSGEEK